APGIIAGAGTTSVVFLSLMFSGLPGLADLGLLVALGVLTGLGVMLGFMPHLVREKARATPPASAGNGHTDPRPPAGHRWAATATVGLLIGGGGLLAWRGLPPYHTGPDALRPTKSSAMDAWQVMERQLGQADHASVPLLVTDHGGDWRGNVAAVRAALDEA